MQLGYGWNSIKLEVYSHVLKAVNYRKMYENVVATYNCQPENCYHSDTQEAGK